MTPDAYTYEKNPSGNQLVTARIRTDQPGASRPQPQPNSTASPRRHREEPQDTSGVILDRRRGDDFMLKALRLIAPCICILLVLFGLLVLAGTGSTADWVTKPDQDTRIDRLLATDTTVLTLLFGCCIAGIALSVSGIMISRKRSRRRYDDQSLALFVFGAVACVVMILYFVFFV